MTAFFVFQCALNLTVICQEEGAFNLNKVLCYSLTLFIAFYLYGSINVPESMLVQLSAYRWWRY